MISVGLIVDQIIRCIIGSKSYRKSSEVAISDENVYSFFAIFLPVGRHFRSFFFWIPFSFFFSEIQFRKFAAQLLSREPRVFIRPNVRGTLVAIEKAASHSVSLFTIIMWGARSRFERI